MKKFEVGQKVEANGNKECRILRYYSEGMVEVRFWSGFRHVGDACVPECDIKAMEA